jgi:hypothetical protein
MTIAAAVAITLDLKNGNFFTIKLAKIAENSGK